MINELERRGAPHLAKEKLKQVALEAKGNMRAMARLLNVSRMTIGNYVARYELNEHVATVRALHSPAHAVKEWWRPEVLEEVNRIRAAAGLALYFPVIRGGNKKNLA